jgi:hypothetical protein
MPQEIKDGFTVDKRTERIIGLGAELSKVTSQYKIKIEKRGGTAGNTHYLTIDFGNGNVDEYVLKNKIPPDTGEKLTKRNAKKSSTKSSKKK